MSEIIDIVFTERGTGKKIEGTLEFNEGEGMQLMFKVDEPHPKMFDARFAAMTAMAEGITALVEGAEEFDRTGKKPKTTPFTMMPMPRKEDEKYMN